MNIGATVLIPNNNMATSACSTSAASIPVTKIGHGVRKVVLKIKAAPLRTKETSLQRLKKEYRLRKSEMTAELLFELWDRDYTRNEFTRLLESKWQQHISPLVGQGLEEFRSQSDMGMHMVV